MNCRHVHTKTKLVDVTKYGTFKSVTSKYQVVTCEDCGKQLSIKHVPDSDESSFTDWGKKIYGHATAHHEDYESDALNLNPSATKKRVGSNESNPLYALGRSGFVIK